MSKARIYYVRASAVTTMHPADNGIGPVWNTHTFPKRIRYSSVPASSIRFFSESENYPCSLHFYSKAGNPYKP